MKIVSYILIFLGFLNVMDSSHLNTIYANRALAARNDAYYCEDENKELKLKIKKLEQHIENLKG